MPATIGRTNFPDDSATAALIPALAAATQVTLMADCPVYIGTAANLNPTTADRAHLIYLTFNSGLPVQLNLSAGSALYAVPYPGNGPSNIDWIIA